ncbi:MULTISPECIES: DUF2834 domain-containing protein [unclassified Coleofasciculus]|uniref:DUF2834 domain-containing protein n=1 Tax=unclassified Coleofasciculus TaxID=2692782 RepID=UPI0018818AE2|nr:MULTISPECIES: DUF2834 domain-containing protein [unclassified Coleofasciculus]MBE9129708.1 DUF2834 domain-containing protein [Coleofasciculus sp. LEGE 07081]MBE9152213.1 DUF2834 domain-containing protein [Coleofasciculus sp. LEGE 07092]
MFRKLGFWLIWVIFISYAFFLAPPNQPDSFELIKNLSTGNWDGINPLIIALFNIMGILPLIYACLIFIDGRTQKIPAWLFATASFGVGAFALLPYLALRQPNQDFPGKKDSVLKLFDSRWFGVALTLGTVSLLGFGFLKGDWSDFIQQWQTSRFIHVMSLDFCLLCLLFPALLGDDMARRGLKNSSWFWAVALVPLVGSLLYLCLRPPLADSGEDVATGTQQAV